MLWQMRQQNLITTIEFFKYVLAGLTAVNLKHRPYLGENEVVRNFGCMDIDFVGSNTVSNRCAMMCVVVCWPILEHP